MIQYLKLLVRSGNDYVSLPGSRPGLRVVGVQPHADGLELDVLCPQAFDQTVMYSEENGARLQGYKGITRISVEVVEDGGELLLLDARDFVGFIGEGSDRRSVFASVRA